MLPLLSGLLFLLIASAAVGGRTHVATAAILLANWCVNTSFAWVMGDPQPWVIFGTVDYFSALMLVVCRASRWQLAVGLTYAIEVLMHVAYGMSSRDPWAVYRYMYGLYYVAWAQLAVCGAWVAWDIAVRRSGAFRRLSHRLARADAKAQETAQW